MDDRAGLSHVLQVMNGFRPGVLEGRYLIVCTKPDEEWAIANLTTEPDAPLQFVDDRRFHSVEDARRAVDELTRAAGIK